MNRISKTAGNLAEKNSEIRPRSRVNFMFWAVPVSAVALVMSLLGLAYLGGNLNPERNLNEFPVAIVNSDVGTEMASGEFRRIGDEIQSQLEEQVDDRFELRDLSADEAQRQLGTGEIYGTLQIPRDFTMQVNAWAIGAVLDNEVSAPQMAVVTNPGAGVGSVQIMEMFGETATGAINDNLGEQLLAQVQEAAEEEGFELNGVTTAAMLQPLDVQFSSTDDLGDGTGGGLSALFWSLLLVLAGFTGAAITNVLVDGKLGVLPTEYGPLFITRRHIGISRLMTLLVKFGFVFLQAPVIAGLFLWIGTTLGMIPSNTFTLWFFSAMMIAAVGIVAQSINALLGNPGLVVNLLFFIAFGLPAAGATLPLQAVPDFFRQVAPLMPLHQVYLGTRSILFFDGQWSAGLGTAMFWAIGAAAVAFVIGVLGTWAFDRGGFTRAIPVINTLPVASSATAAEPSASAETTDAETSEAEPSDAEGDVVEENDDVGTDEDSGDDENREGDVDPDPEDNGDDGEDEGPTDEQPTADESAEETVDADDPDESDPDENSTGTEDSAR